MKLRNRRLRFRSALSALPDIGGWKVYTPVTANPAVVGGLTSYLNQTGTRLQYVDPSQVVATTMLALDQAATYNASTNPHGGPYYWNGTNIIDGSGNTAPLTGIYSGVAYGTDPMNPSAAVQAFKRISYVSYNRFGNNRLNGTVMNGDYTSPGNGQCNASGGRIGKPDWTFIKRGTTLVLEDDYYDLNLEGNGALLRTSMYSSISIPGGSSLSAMSIVGAYGPLTIDRPIITKCSRNQGFITKIGGAPSSKNPTNTAYVSLYFDGYDRSHQTSDRSAVSLRYTNGTPGEKSHWYEDCTFAGGGGFDTGPGNTDFTVEFFRCQYYDVFGTRSSGPSSGSMGTGEMNLYDCIIGRNGKSNNPVINNGGTDSIYDRNFYWFYGKASQTIDNCLILPGGSGEQFRAGVTLNKTYFMASGVGLAGQNGDPFVTAQVNSGAVTSCVFEDYYKNNASHSSGGGLAIFYGAHDVIVSDNVVTDAGLSTADRATVGATPSAGGVSIGGSPEGWYHPQLATTNNIRVTGNKIVNRTNTVAFGGSEGVNNVAYLSSYSTHYVATSGAATWNDIGNYGTTTATTALIAGETVVPLAALIGGAPSGGVYSAQAGGNIGIVLANAATHWTTILSISGLNATITVALPSASNINATVTTGQPANYQYPASNLNTIDFNTVIGQSNTNANAKAFTLQTGAPTLPTETRVDTTTVANNTHMTVAAAGAAGYDLNRCLYTYCLIAGFAPSLPSQEIVVNELIAYLKANQRKGQYNPAWTGKPICNHVRAGVGMAALT